MRIPHLRTVFAGRIAALGLWVTLESPSVTEIAGVMGLDWVVVDAEHGQLDFKEIADHLRALKGTRTTSLVRVPVIDRGYIKRVLDLGAEGVIVPQVETAEDVAEAVRFAKYPPNGVRGVGSERATLWGRGISSYTRTADRRTLVIPMIENVRAGKNIEAILAVAGVDARFFGSCDYAASAGALGSFTTPRVDREILKLHRAARRRGIPTGLLALDSAQVKARQRQGFRMLGIGIDSNLLIRGLEAMLGASGRTLSPDTWHA